MAKFMQFAKKNLEY